MTKKVTGKDLEKLLEGVLGENTVKYSALDIPDTTLKTAIELENPAKDKKALNAGLELIAGVDKKFNEIGVNDLEKFIDDPNLVTTNVEHALIFLQKLGEKTPQEMGQLKSSLETSNKASVARAFLSQPSAYQTLKQLSGVAKRVLENFKEFQKAGTKDLGTVSNPSLNPTRIEAADLPRDYVKVLENYLGSEGDIVSRLNKMSEVSDKYLGQPDDVLPQQSIRQTLSEIMILDLFNYISKELDSGSGAYFFEALLALMAGGESTGKKLTPAGKAGAYDFVDKDGNYGSAKYFKEASRELKQAISGFEALAEESGGKAVSVRYVIALKKQDAEQFDKKARGTSDPTKLIALQIYTPEVIYDDGKFTIDGEEMTVKPSDKNIYFNKWISESRPSTILRVARRRTETFRTGIQEKISETKFNTKRAFEAFTRYFDFLTSAEEQARIYSSTGDPTDGNSTIEELNGAEKEVKNLMDAFRFEKAKDPFRSGRQNVGYRTDESKKITAKMLQKLIEENFKK